MDTSYLKLKKPMIGSQGWGAAINHNWDKIDSEYNKMSSNLNLIESRIEETGSFSFLKYTYTDNNGATHTIDADYLLLKECIIEKITGVSRIYYLASEQELDEYGKIKLTKSFNGDINSKNTSSFGSGIIGTLGESSDTGVKEFIEDDNQYKGEYFNDSNVNHNQFSSLPNFVAFYLRFPEISADSVDDNTTIRYYAFGMLLNFDEILIKTDRIVDNARVTVISKFKQVLGGYYMPSSTPNEPNTITFTKAQAASNEGTIKIVIPRHVYNSSITEKTIFNGTNVLNIDTGITQTATMKLEDDNKDITYYQHISDIRFYIKDNENQIPVVVNYKLGIKDDKWFFYIEDNYFDSGEEVYLCYSVNQHE